MTDEKQLDYIQHGSEQHATFLGLRKATKDDTTTHKGWALTDETLWGPNARPEFIKAHLIGRVNELESKPTVPANAQKLWVPGRS